MNTNNIQEIIEIFKKGGIVIFPTDTAYGIGCRMDNEDAVRRVYEIKQRSLDSALLVLVDSVEMAEEYVEIPEDVKEKLIKLYWPGGLTIFLKTRMGKVPGIITANKDILAVRWPKHKILNGIIHEVGVPIIATSANRSGEETPYVLEDLDEGIVEQVGTVLKGECTYGKESTIIDCTVEPWKMIREGAIDVRI